jgi:hypothetical protein
MSEFDAELEKFSSLGSQARMAALAILAHDLTVGIRSAVLDLPSTEAVERLRELNEYLHQISGRIYSADEHSGDDERTLLRDIAEDAAAKGMKWVIARRLAAAVRYGSAHDRKQTTAFA